MTKLKDLIMSALDEAYDNSDKPEELRRYLHQDAVIEYASTIEEILTIYEKHMGVNREAINQYMNSRGYPTQ